MKANHLQMAKATNAYLHARVISQNIFAGFVQQLKDNNLVVADPAKFTATKADDLDRLRHRYLKAPSLTLVQILEAKLLPLTSKQGIRHWIAEGKIMPGEVIHPKTKNGGVKILTSAIRRLGYAN